jgi:hypothetical protein
MVCTVTANCWSRYGSWYARNQGCASLPPAHARQVSTALVSIRVSAEHQGRVNGEATPCSLRTLGRTLVSSFQFPRESTHCRLRLLGGTEWASTKAPHLRTQGDESSSVIHTRTGYPAEWGKVGLNFQPIRYPATSARDTPEACQNESRAV